MLLLQSAHSSNSLPPLAVIDNYIIMMSQPIYLHTHMHCTYMNTLMTKTYIPLGY